MLNDRRTVYCLWMTEVRDEAIESSKQIILIVVSKNVDGVTHQTLLFIYLYNAFIGENYIIITLSVFLNPHNH